MKLNCSYCGKEFDCAPSRLKKSKTGIICCSVNCATAYKKENQILNCTCDYCGKKFHKKESHIKNLNYCSVECLGNHRKTIYLGENNPNAFCRIPLGNKIMHCGYYWLYLPDHPLATKNGYIREHRIVAEQYLLTENNRIEIDGKFYLNPKFEVHHIDFNKLNNEPNNLMVMTKSEHQSLHQQMRNNAMKEYLKSK